MDTTKNKKYEPDDYDILINVIWNFLWFSFGIAGMFCLLAQKQITIYGLSGFFFVLAVWFSIISTHVLARRFDKKYRDGIILDTRSKQFILFPFVFSRETMIKCRWYRTFVYFLSFNKSPTKSRLRKEIIPNFKYNSDIKFFDKFFFYAQFISLLVGVVLFYFAKWG